MGQAIVLRAVKNVETADDLTDAMFVPGLFSVPEALANWNQTAVEVRNAAGTVKATVTATGIVLTSPIVTVAGDLHVTGEVTAKQGGSNITLSTHVHSDPQGGSVGAPTG